MRVWYAYKPKQEKKKMTFGIDDIIISFFAGITFCLYLIGF